MKENTERSFKTSVTRLPIASFWQWRREREKQVGGKVPGAPNKNGPTVKKIFFRNYYSLNPVFAQNRNEKYIAQNIL